VYGQQKLPREENYIPRTLRELSTLYPPYMAKAINERTEAEKREMAMVEKFVKQ
jgi:hypothetical protein